MATDSLALAQRVLSGDPMPIERRLAQAVIDLTAKVAMRDRVLITTERERDEARARLALWQDADVPSRFEELEK